MQNAVTCVTARSEEHDRLTTSKSIHSERGFKSVFAFGTRKEMRFGLEDGEPHTLEEVGQAIGVTRERTRQIEAEVVGKLREAPDAIDCVPSSGAPPEALPLKSARVAQPGRTSPWTSSCFDGWDSHNFDGTMRVAENGF